MKGDYITLKNAEGIFTAVEPMKNKLPLSEGNMNFVLDYDRNSNNLKNFEAAFNYFYPGKDFALPRISNNGMDYLAKDSGGRCARIDSSIFGKQISIDGKKVKSLKIKGCKSLLMPPNPVPFMPEEHRESQESFAGPETFIAYKEDGTPYTAFKDQPNGMTCKDAVVETTHNLILNMMGVPTNSVPLGVGSYEGVNYYGNPLYSREKYEPTVMGTGVYGLYDDDYRVLDMIGWLNTKLGDDIEAETATAVIENVHNLSVQTGMNYSTLIKDVIMKGSGKILSQMHRNGVLHGPRQAHYGNYVLPSKKDKQLKICDFEASGFIQQYSDEQFRNYVADEIHNIICSSGNLYSSLLNSIVEAKKKNAVPKECDIKSMIHSFVHEEPVDIFIEGYTGGEYIVKDKNDVSSLPHKIVNSVIDIESIREEQNRFFENVIDSFVG